MENTASSRSVSLGWKLALFPPLAVAVALQIVAHWQHDLHSELKLSMIGNLFLSVALIVESLLVMRTSTKWGIAMLIFTSIVLGFGLHTLLRVL